MTDRARRVRALVVMPGIGAGGGAEQSFASTAPGLLDDGVALHLAVLTDRQALVPALERDGVVIHDLSSATRLASRVRAIRRLVRDVRPDLVHAALFDATLPSQLASLGGDVPLLVSWTSTSYGAARLAEPNTSGWRVRGYQQMERVLGRSSRSWYHAVTPAVAELNARALGVDRSRVMVGERGRDPRLFHPDDGLTAAELLAGDLGDAAASAEIVLAVGRHEPAKGYETLLAAFEQLADRRPSAHLVIVGRPGASTADLEVQAAGLRHGDRVHLVGQRGDVAQLLAVADVVACSSWREGSAGALIEAMATATPVVSVPVAGLDGVLVDEQNALVVPRDQLASGLQRVLEDPALARRLAEGALQTFERRFTIERASSRMAEIYRTVVERSAALSDGPG